MRGMTKELENHTADTIVSGFSFLEAAYSNEVPPCLIADSRDFKIFHKSPKEIGSSLWLFQLPILPDRIKQKNLAYCLSTMTSNGTFRFFEKEDLLPPDRETTAVAAAKLLEHGTITPQQAHISADQMVSGINPNDILPIFFSQHNNTNQIDHVSALNMIYFFHLLGRETEIASTEDWTFTMLESGAYLEGSRYYPYPESYLYFAAKLAAKFPQIHSRIGTRLTYALQERIGGTSDYPVDLAMRVTASKLLGRENIQEEALLRNMQRQDGSWNPDAVYRYGGKHGFFGSKSISTILALEALSR